MWSGRIPLVTITVLVLGISQSISMPGARRGEWELPAQKGSQEEGLASYFKKWIKEDVVYIITPEEKSVFNDLTTSEEKEKFIEQFWLRRDTDPRTPNNEFKEEHYRRISYANEQFTSGNPGWKTDRGMIYIAFGKPAQIEYHPTGGNYDRTIWEGGGSTLVYPFERWRYRHIEGVGDDVEIEFVDKTMSGKYEMALSPDEKDALMIVPGGGMTWREEIGLADRADRVPFLFTKPGASNPSIGSLRAKDQPFQRMERFYNLQRPPQIKFQDLKTIVTTNITYNELPFALRSDFIRLSSDKVLVPVTVELPNENLEFGRQLNFNRAVMNVYGLVTSLANRIVAEFEDTVVAEYTDEFFEQGKRNRSLYQKIIALQPGQRFKLDLVIKDQNSGRAGVISRLIKVPKFSADELQSSSIILANKISAVPTNSDYLEQYVIGDLKIQPNVTSEYLPDQVLIPYLQIYNASIDQTSLEPLVSVTFAITSDGKVLEKLEDPNGTTVQFFSGERMVVVGKLPLKSVPPGEYELEIRVEDQISSHSLTARTQFRVNQP